MDAVSGSFAEEMVARIGQVFDAHPELPDHRQEHPWLSGWLGDPSAPVWLVAENPSATQVDRIHSETATADAQWAASRGDRLLREALCETGLKLGDPLGPGGWSCYLTDVMKSEVRVKDWNGTSSQAKRHVADLWSPVLRFELEFGRPKLIIALGKAAQQHLVRLERQSLIGRLPRLVAVDHYSYVMMRPDNVRKLGPGDPRRQRDWKLSIAEVVRSIDE